MQSRAERKDLYTVLGVAKTASIEDIRKAYRAKALKWHPDKVEESQREKAEEVFKDIKQAYEILSDVERRQMYDRYGAAYLEPDFEPAMFTPQTTPFGQPAQPFQVPVYQYPQPIPKPFRPQFMPRSSSTSSFSSAYPSDRLAQQSPATPNIPGSFYPYAQPQLYYATYVGQPPTPGPSYPPTPISGYWSGYTTPLHGNTPQPMSTPGPAPFQGNAVPQQHRHPPFTHTQPVYYMSPPTSPPSQYMSPVQSSPSGHPLPPTADYFSRGPPPQPWAGQPPPPPMNPSYWAPPSAPVSRSASYTEVRPTPQRAWTEQNAGYRREPNPVPQPKRRWVG